MKTKEEIGHIEFRNNIVMIGLQQSCSPIIFPFHKRRVQKNMTTMSYWFDDDDLFYAPHLGRDHPCPRVHLHHFDNDVGRRSLQRWIPSPFVWNIPFQQKETIRRRPSNSTTFQQRFHHPMMSVERMNETDLSPLWTIQEFDDDDYGSDDFQHFIFGARNPSSSIQKKRKLHTIPIQLIDADDFQSNKESNGSLSGKKACIAERSMSTSPASVTNVVRKRRMEQHAMNSAVRDSVFTYFSSVWDVPSDGNCGYYVLFDFLEENGLLPDACHTITDLRRTIYTFAIQRKDELLAKDSYFSRLGYWKVSHDYDGSLSEQVLLQDISRIYNEKINFELGCSQEYWMNANIVLPLVAMLFGINIWVLSADGDPFYDPGSGKTLHDHPYTTMYSLDKDNNDVKREIIRGTVAFPLDSPNDISNTVNTAYLIHVRGNHYMAAKR
jgi:hypothetical protein